MILVQSAQKPDWDYASITPVISWRPQRNGGCFSLTCRSRLPFRLLANPTGDFPAFARGDGQPIDAKDVESVLFG